MNLMCYRAAASDKNCFNQFINNLDKAIIKLEGNEVKELDPSELAGNGIGFSPMSMGIVASNRPEVLEKARGNNG